MEIGQPREADGTKVPQGAKHELTHLKDCGDLVLKEGAVGEGSDSHLL